MLHNPYKSKKWYLSMDRQTRSLTNQGCGPLLIWNGPLQIWNGTLFSKMAHWCGQVSGYSLFDNKFFPVPVLWVKIKKINIFYHFPQYESLRIVLCHYDLCWFLVVYGFDKLAWTWSGKTVLFRGRSWKKPPRTPEPAEEVPQAKKQYEQ
jgi:hypothetical protein